MSWFTMEDGVGRITLAYPAIDPAWIDAFGEAVDAAVRADGLRAVLISGTGRAFTVGGDVGHFAAHDLRETLEAMVGPFNAALLRLAVDVPAPVVLAAQGSIGGGGLGLLWASDQVLVADHARLGTGFAALGLSGDGGSSWYLPRLVGLRRATQLMLANRVLTAAEAVEWGLVDRAVPADELEAAAEAAVAGLAAGPTVALTRMRRMLRASVPLDRGLAAEVEAMLDCGATADAAEGVAAFVAKRPAAFTGE